MLSKCASTDVGFVGLTLKRRAALLVEMGLPRYPYCRRYYSLGIDYREVASDISTLRASVTTYVPYKIARKLYNFK